MSLDPQIIFHTLRPPTRFQDLIDVIATVFVRCLQVVQLLLQLVDVGLQLSRFRGQALPDIRRRAEDEPIDPSIRRLADAKCQVLEELHLPDAFVEVRLSRKLDQLG